MPALDVRPEQFRRLATRITELATQYLSSLDSRPIAPPTTGEKSNCFLDEPLPEQGMGEVALEDLSKVIDACRAQNGRFFGYVLGSGEPVAATADLLASVLNQNVTAWRSGPSAVMIEKAVVRWLAQAIRCPEFHGYLTGGGSSANLMGLAMAREAIATANENGVAPGLVIYGSEEIHMSIPKSVALLGIGRANLRLIPTDARLRMDPCALDAAIKRDQASGRIPMAIVASAGTVKTGVIDPLGQIAEIARRHRAWFHIDGAYGALASIAEPQKFVGMNLADSVSLDPHKWLYQPLDCGCLLYRDRFSGQKTFSHSGDYARALTSDPIEGFAFFEESLELSRRFRALKLWLSLRYHGFAAFRESIKKDLRHARQLADAIARTHQLELVAAGELSAVCFRLAGDATSSDQELNRLNEQVLARTQKRGRIYLSNALIGGKFCLRACIVNHRTQDADVESVVPEVLAAAREIRGPIP